MPLESGSSDQAVANRQRASARNPKDMRLSTYKYRVPTFVEEFSTAIGGVGGPLGPSAYRNYRMASDPETGQWMMYCWLSAAARQSGVVLPTANEHLLLINAAKLAEYQLAREHGDASAQPPMADEYVAARVVSNEDFTVAKVFLA